MRTFITDLVKAVRKVANDFTELKNVICCKNIQQEQEILTNVNR